MKLEYMRFIFSKKSWMNNQQHILDWGKRLHGTKTTQWAGSDRLQKSPKSLLSALQFMYISQISTHIVWVRSFRPFWNHKKNSSNRRTSKESFKTIRARPENFKNIFLLIKKMEYSFPIFCFDFVTNYYQSNYFVINNHL